MREVPALILQYGPPVQSLFRSGLSVRIALELSENPLSLINLTRAIPGTSSASIYRSLKRLLNEDLVEESGGTYRLSNAGTILMRRMIPLIRAFREPSDADESVHLLVERYHEYETEMNAILLSGHALTILCALRDRTASRNDLREITGARSSTLGTRLRLLTDAGCIREGAEGYFLTPRGEKVANQVYMFLKTMALISRHKKFWNGHAISMLPDFAIETAYRLSEVEINVDTPGNISANLLKYFEGVAQARWIAGISDWTTPDLHKAYSAEVMAGKPVRMLFPPEIIATMYREPYLENMRLYHRYPNLQILVPEQPLGYALTVTDSLFTLKLYAKDCVSFTNARLMDFNSEEAIEWGMTLFDYFEARSTPLEDYLEEHPDLLHSGSPGPDSHRLQ